MLEIPEIQERVLRPEILEWTLRRPERANALNPAMLAWLDARSRILDGEIVVLRAQGERSFCAGFDMDALANAGDAEFPDQILIQCTQSMRAALACFVAVVTAPVYGAGVELLAHCDFIYAVASSSIEVPAGRLGVVYHPDGLLQIRARFGDTVARRLLILADCISADDPDLKSHIHCFNERSELESALAAQLETLEALPTEVRAAHCAFLRQPMPSIAPAILERHRALRARAYKAPAFQTALRLRAARKQK